MNRRRFVVVAALLLAGTIRAEDQIIYPHPAAPAVPAAAREGGAGWLLPALALVAAAGGGWLLWRQRQWQAGPGGGGRRLTVAESRSLGNRQYLVVAEYDGQKFLLGVCPGRINLLSVLEAGQKQPGSGP